MRTVLALAGCGPRLELGLDHAALPAPALVALSGPAPRSDVILDAVDLLLRASGIGADDIRLVVATRGPGSFTGLRVALATAQGLMMARGIPGHAFSSLIVQAARTTVRPCIAVQPARRGFVYAQPFSDASDGEPPADPVLISVDDLVAHRLPVVAAAGLDLPAAAPRAPAPLSTAEALLALARRMTSADPATLVPLYVEPPQASPPRTLIPTWPHSHRVS